MTSPYVDNNYYNNLRVAYPNSLGGYTLGVAPLGVVGYNGVGYNGYNGVGPVGYNGVNNPYNVYPNANGTYTIGLTAPLITGATNIALGGAAVGAVGVANLAYDPYAVNITGLDTVEPYAAAYYYNELRYRGLRY